MAGIEKLDDMMDDMMTKQPRHAKVVDIPLGDVTPRIFVWLTPRFRSWFYLVLTAAIPLLIAYGIIDDQTAPLWIALVAAILGQGTAWLHTPNGDSVNGSDNV